MNFNAFLFSKTKSLIRNTSGIIAILIGLNLSVYADEIICSSTSEITTALNNAQPGDTIRIASGTYTNTSFKTKRSGTAALPIVIESLDSLNQATLSYGVTSSGTILQVDHGYWVVRNLKFKTGNKGIVLDAASYSIVDNVTVDSIGQEAIHVINGSSNVQILNCNITNTGTVSPQYGEGVYVGSDYGKWATYAKECDDVLVKNCTIGPNVRAEHVDIKEGTLRTIVEDCVFYGSGMSGLNGAGSFIDAKGNNDIIRNNTGYRQGNSLIVAAFENHRINNWGNINLFCSNYVEMDDATLPIVDASSGLAYVSGNTGTPTPTDMYDGNYQIISVNCDNPTTDCYGTVNGTAYEDDCNNCVGGTTGETACVQDCNGDWGGAAEVDYCEVCSGGLTGITPNSSCTLDCNNDIDGTAAIDRCGVCSGGNTGIAIDDCALSTNDNELDYTTLYPNPTTGIVHLQQTSDYKVTTVTGIQIQEGKSNLLDLSAEPKGIYIIFIDGKSVLIIKE